MSRDEQETFVAFFNTFKLSRQLETYTDLYDGRALFEVMSGIDASHFKNSVARAANASAGSSDNWVLKMNTMKRLYRLLLSYALPSPHPSLSKSTLREPDFSSIGKGNNKAGLLQVCRMCLVAGVWSHQNEHVIGKIQGLKESQQRILMSVIEDIMATLPVSAPMMPDSSSEGSDLAELASHGQRKERDLLASENDDLRAQVGKLAEETAKLQATLADVTSDKDDLLGQLSTFRADASAGLKMSQSGVDRHEVLTLREDLLKTEEALGHTEAELDKQTNLVAELTKTIEMLKVKAADATRLKDQLDEHRYAADRLKKSENVIEKYKKKLEDMAELRRELKSSEEESSRLVNTNVMLEVELKKLASTKTLVDNYKAQIADLEKQTDTQTKEITELSFALDAAREQVEALEAQSERDREELQLNQERVKELELVGETKTSGSPTSTDVPATLDGEMEGAGDHGDGLLGGSTRTELKLKIRALTTELEVARSSSEENGKIAELKGLLAEANKAKQRYQQDYLDAHRDKLVLQSSLDEIQSGKGGADDTPTTIAIRQRLNETVYKLDQLRVEQQELQVKYDNLERSHVIAKSDLSLVNKDQLDILNSLRESVKQDKESLESEIAGLKDQLVGARDKNRMQLEQINSLLLEKVSLQTAGIDQREKALEREQDVSDLRAALSGKGLSKESQDRLLGLHDDNVKLSEDIKILSSKLSKARAFIKEQDALLKQKSLTSIGNFEEAHAAYKATIAGLQEDLVRTKRATQLLEQRYRLEQQLILTAWHDLGSRTVREHLAHASNKRHQPKPPPTSWLTQQRQKMGTAIFSR